MLRRPRAARRPDARVSLALAGSLVLTAVACRDLLRFAPASPAPPPSGTASVEEWFFEPSDSSPVVILLLCGWLLWRRRHRLAALWGRTGSWGVTAGLWLAAAAMFGWAVRARAPELQAFALVPALLGAGNLLGGIAALRVIAGPAAVLVFAVPIPAPLLNQILWRLQIDTADFTGALLRMIHMPVLVSGDRIFTQGRQFQIIETCSGMRSIETLALLAILMIDLFGRRGRHAVALLLLSPVVAFLINGLRCLGLIFNPFSEIESIHSLQGIAMLLGGVLLLYFADGFMERLWPSSEVPASPRAAGSARSDLGPRAAIAFGFSGFLVAISWLPPFAPTTLAANSPAAAIAPQFDGWVGDDQPNDWVFYGTAGFGQVVHRHYARGAEEIELFVGQAGTNRVRSYLTQKAGYPGSGWIVEDEEPARIAGRAATKRVLRKGVARLLAVAWFEASPGLAAESARALLGFDSTRRFQRSQIPLAVRLTTPINGAGDPAAAPGWERLERFAEQISPALQTLAVPRES
jgi:exosortase